MFIQTPALIALAIGLLAVFVAAIIVAKHMYRQGWKEGWSAMTGALDAQKLATDKWIGRNRQCHNELVAEQLAHEQSRNNAAQALEQMELTHQEDIAALSSKLRKINRTLEMADLSHQHSRDAHRVELRAARTLLSDQELELLTAMAEKLQLASSSLHATQQYKDAKQAKALGSSGLRLAHSIAARQQPAQQEAA